MALVAIFYSIDLERTYSMVLSSEEKFIDCCERVGGVDWAHLMEGETGEILHTWRKEK